MVKINEKNTKELKVRKRSYSEQIEFIIKNFDFDRVEQISKSLGLAYFDYTSGIKKPPTKDKLIDMARYVLNECKNTKCFYIGCGGFVAIKKKKNLFLLFSIYEVSGYDD